MGVCYAKAKNKPPNISNILAQPSTSESRVGARGANQSGQEVKSSDLHSSLDHEGKNSDRILLKSYARFIALIKRGIYSTDSILFSTNSSNFHVFNL